jgi:hypothetical protein
MNTVRVFVRHDNTTTIICPSCNNAQRFSAEPFRKKTHAIKIRCKCKATFTVQLDFREYYRKPTSLPGTYKIVQPAGAGRGQMTVQNISRTGIGFTVSGRHFMKTGQLVQLEFHLDDQDRSKLVQTARICSINNNYIGCEFTDVGMYDKKLGFYLRP